MPLPGLVWLLPLGLLIGGLVWPLQAISALGFVLQRQWWELPGLARSGGQASAATPWLGALVVFGATAGMLGLAWGRALGAGRGGGVAPVLALDRAPQGLAAEREQVWLRTLSLRVQLVRLPLLLLLLTHLGGLSVGVESPAAALGASGLLNTGMGQPARLPGLLLGPLAPGLWGWVLLLTLAGSGLGALFVRLLIPLAGWLQRQLGQRRWLAVLALSGLLALLALASGGLSLNDGSLSLQALLQGRPGGGAVTFLWRWLASLLSIAAAAPGGLMHDAMTLGALLTTPLHGMAGLEARALAQLAAVGATALFAAANGTPVFCAVFVFTLQGDPSSLPLLLLVGAVSSALADLWRGEEWNAHQAQALLR